MASKSVGEALDNFYDHFTREMKNPFYGFSSKIFSQDAFSVPVHDAMNKKSCSIAGELFELLVGSHFEKYSVYPSEEKIVKYGLIDVFIFPLLVIIPCWFLSESLLIGINEKTMLERVLLQLCDSVVSLVLALNSLIRAVLAAALMVPFLPFLMLLHCEQVFFESDYSTVHEGFIDFFNEIFANFTGLSFTGVRKTNAEKDARDFVALLDPLLLFVPNVVNWLDDKAPYYLLKPFVLLCSVVKYVLGVALVMLFMPYVALAYCALKNNVESPLDAFSSRTFAGHYSEGALIAKSNRLDGYGVRNFFDFFAGCRKTDCMYQEDSYESCGLLDLLVVPFMIDYVYQYFKNAARGEKGVAAFMAKVGLCVTAPLYVVNMAVRYALATALTAAVMVMKAVVLPIYAVAVALPYGTARFFGNEGFDELVESGWDGLTQVY